MSSTSDATMDDKVCRVRSDRLTGYIKVRMIPREPRPRPQSTAMSATKAQR